MKRNQLHLKWCHLCVCVLIQCELYLASSLQQLLLPNESLRKCARRPEFTCDFSALYLLWWQLLLKVLERL